MEETEHFNSVLSKYTFQCNVIEIYQEILPRTIQIMKEGSQFDFV